MTDEKVVQAGAEFESKLDSFEQVLATVLDDVALAAQSEPEGEWNPRDMLSSSRNYERRLQVVMWSQAT